MIALLLSICSISTAPSHVFVVSPKGNNTWSGTSGKPFRTLEKARDSVRAYRASHTHLVGPVEVRLKPGIYELSEAFRLGPEDSGTAQSPTQYVGDHATISGGRRVTGFTKDSMGWWKTNIPEVKSGNWRFSQLFVNGDRRYRPRLPKQGYYNFTSEVAPTAASKGHGYDRFGVRAGDIKPTWTNLQDIEVLCFHIWDMSRMRVASYDASSNVVTTTGPTGFDDGWANFHTGNRYLVENVPDALSDPGEWYLDNKSGELTYIPKPGESLEKCVIEAPLIPTLLDMHGDVDSGKPVEYVNFVDLDFSYTNWSLGPKGRFFPQAEADLGAAVHAEMWRHGEMKGCRIQHTGEYGMELVGGCRNDRIEQCVLSDLGAGGLKIGETRLYDSEDKVTGGITFAHSEISHGGRLHPAAIGVFIGQSDSNTVEDNRIYDLYYTGVSIGWTWGYGKSQAHHNLVLNNEIFDIGQGVLSDMGGIYTLGIEPGTTLSGNRIHDIDSFSYGGWGIYPDEGSSHELIENNLVYRTKSGGFHQHYGQENVVRNNIFAFAREAEIIRTRAEDHLSFTFENNIVYWKDAPLLGSNWSGNNYKLDGNTYWRIDGKPVDFAGMTLETWRAKGQDVHSQIADPLFVDPINGDFRLKANSPALQKGFKPFLMARPPKNTFTKVPPAFPTLSTETSSPKKS